MPIDAPPERDLNDLTLIEWNRQLERHFQALAARRAISGWPVFALEHGLSTDEVDALERAVHLALARQESPSLKAYLPWVVYATEFGYRYSGDEYWQSFAKETPRWNDVWRGFIRESFRRFAKLYHGAKPEGAWAGNFTIICWPITHGVLPRDLQRQLARLLYDARFSLRPELFATALALGTHLRGLSQNASARFREFSENALLLGQIAAALLVQEPEQELLSSGTLHRIVDDITRERAAAEWLKEARNSAHRLRVRGLSSRSGTQGDVPSHQPESEESKATARDGIGRAIRARFVIRPRTEAEWDVMLELPDLAPIQRILPKHHEALARSRSHVAGAIAKVLARGRLIGSGAQRIAIEKWPEPNTPLVTLEDGTPELGALLNSSLRSPPGDSVLFRVAVDGLGYSQIERSVRPGSTYVLLRKEEVERPIAGFQKLSLTCAGIHGLKFTVPDTISELWETLLGNLKLSIVRTLHVWPAGLCPVAWDGEGEATWLERDEILLGVHSDHSVDALEVSLGGAAFRRFPISPSDSGKAHFITLGRLPAGTYLATLRTASIKNPDQPSGRLNLRVLPERGLGVGSPTRQPIALSSFPAVPALEDIWEGGAQLQLRGPTTLDVSCCVSLRSRHSAVDLYTKAITRIRLPLESDEWDNLFDRHVRKDEKAQEIFDTAHEICIEFSAGAHGAARLSAEREFTPLRWTVRKDAGVPLMCLLDDGGAASIRSHYRAMETPDRLLPLDEEAVERGCMAPFPGGLFVATDGAQSASAVFVPPGKALTLAQLRINPSVIPHPREPAKLRGLFRTAAEWQAARTKGSALAVSFRRKATQAIIAEACGTIGGDSWLRAEHSWTADEGHRTMRLMKEAVSTHADERGLAETIVGRAPEWALMDPIERLREFAACVRRTARCLKHDDTAARGKSFVESFAQRTAAHESIAALCEFALCAAGSPMMFGKMYQNDAMDRGIQELIDKPIIIRVARLAVVAIHLARQNDEPNATLYAGWAR